MFFKSAQLHIVDKNCDYIKIRRAFISDYVGWRQTSRKTKLRKLFIHTSQNSCLSLTLEHKSREKSLLRMGRRHKIFIFHECTATEYISTSSNFPILESRIPSQSRSAFDGINFGKRKLLNSSSLLMHAESKHELEVWRLKSFEEKENKWSVLNPATNDATRIHPLENSVFRAIKSELCCECSKIFLITNCKSFNYNWNYNLCQQSEKPAFSSLLASIRLQIQSSWVQLTTRPFFRRSAVCIEYFHITKNYNSHYENKLSFVFLIKQKKVFMFCVSHSKRKLFHFHWMKNYSIHRDSSFYTEIGFLMHYGRVKSGRGCKVRDHWPVHPSYTFYSNQNSF